MHYCDFSVTNIRHMLLPSGLFTYYGIPEGGGGGVRGVSYMIKLA